MELPGSVCVKFQSLCGILIAFVLGAMQTSFAGNADSLDLLASSPEWTRLLEYKTHWFTGWHSTVDGKDFFFSPQGARDPLAEMKAFISELETGEKKIGPLSQPAYCAFPARRVWLEKKLQRVFPKVSCEKLDEFMGKIDPENVSMVFATAYPSNPASMFGHTFLKFKKKGGKADLLDSTINYAAMVPDEENAFAFAWFGIMGGYKGEFSLLPYYAKLEEYSFSESRDLWEYELDFNPEELRMLLYVVWEIETTSYFDYFFFDENCSLKLLAIIEAAKPQWTLTRHFLHMIPGESVKALADTPGAVRSVHLRPSLMRRLNHYMQQLSEAQKKSFYELKSGSSLTATSDTKVLDSYVFYLQSEKYAFPHKWKPEQQANYLAALNQRAAVKEKSELLEPEQEVQSRPDLGHGPYKVGLGSLVEKTRSNQVKFGSELLVQFAYHDLLDSDVGYLPHSQILFPNFRFRYYERDHQFKLDEAEFFSIVALNPWNLVRKPLAWKARLTWDHMLDLPCYNCEGLQFEGGVGGALASFAEGFTFWNLTGPQLDASAELTGKFRAGLFNESGILYTFGTVNKIKISLKPQMEFFPHDRDRFRVRSDLGFSHAFSRGWQMRAEGIFWDQKSQPLRWESKILGIRYF